MSKRSYVRLLCSRVSSASKGGEGEARKGEGKETHAPLSVVCEDRVRLTKRKELFPGLRLFVHIRMKLLAQLQGLEKNIRSKFCMINDRNREGAKDRDILSVLNWAWVRAYVPCNRQTRWRMRHERGLD